MSTCSVNASVDPIAGVNTGGFSNDDAEIGAVADVNGDVSGSLGSMPSLTINWATYVPARSATKVGLTVVAPDSVAVLPVGFDRSDHE